MSRPLLYAFITIEVLGIIAGFILAMFSAAIGNHIHATIIMAGVVGLFWQAGRHLLMLL